MIAKQIANDTIAEIYGNSLTYDCYKKRYYNNNDVINLSRLRHDLIRNKDVDITESDIEFLLEQNCLSTFHSLGLYLEKSYLEYGTNNAIDTLCKEILKCSSTIEEIYVKKFLVAAVARVFKPGCKVDQMLILQSNRGGLGKTTFFTELAGLDNFNSPPANLADLELRKQCAVCWFNEIGEVETLMNRRNLPVLKNFITCRVDRWRKFHRTSEMDEVPRTFVVCGTTNKSNFLCDDASDNERRFWVVKINEKINIEWVTRNRDRIWAEAVHLYKENYQWWLTDNEETLSDGLNDEYKDLSNFALSFIPHIKDNYIDTNQPFTLEKVIAEINFLPSKHLKEAGGLLVKVFKLKKPKNASIYNGQRKRWWNLNESSS